MSRPKSPLVRGTLLLANAFALIGSGWFMRLAWNAWTHSPPQHEAAQSQLCEIVANCLSFAFPYLTGCFYSLAAALTLSGIKPVLHAAPPKWAHGLIIVLCIVSALTVNWRLLGTSAWAFASWFTAAIPAILSATVPRWRRHTYQIIGLMSGMDILTMIPYTSGMALGFAATWIGSAILFFPFARLRNGA